MGVQNKSYNKEPHLKTFLCQWNLMKIKIWGSFKEWKEFYFF